LIAALSGVTTLNRRIILENDIILNQRVVPLTNILIEGNKKLSFGTDGLIMLLSENKYNGCTYYEDGKNVGFRIGRSLKVVSELGNLKVASDGHSHLVVFGNGSETRKQIQIPSGREDIVVLVGGWFEILDKSVPQLVLYNSGLRVPQAADPNELTRRNLLALLSVIAADGDMDSPNFKTECADRKTNLNSDSDADWISQCYYWERMSFNWRLCGGTN
jgi:hypothetical protein